VISSDVFTVRANNTSTTPGMDHTRNHPGRLVQWISSLLVGATIVGGAALGVTTGTAQAVADDDWLGVVNTYRAMSGLDPVGADATWSAQAQAHSCYMLQNGIAHDEIPGRPGYTSGGDVAGNSGNVAVSSSVGASPRSHIELWMTGPFHAIGILRHNLRTTGFGLCASDNTPTPWHSGATLDVIRGLDNTPRPSQPTVFPGDGATVPLHSFITEYPNPLTMCGWSGAAGLPLIAMMPSDVTAANATLVGPAGPIATCVLHKGNVSDATARSILDGENGVIVMPRDPLADGTYTVSVTTDGGSANWSFSVNRNGGLNAPAPQPPQAPTQAVPTGSAARFQAVAPFRLVDTRLGKGAVRLTGGTVTKVKVTDDADVVAVSANFVSTDSGDAGYLTTFHCEGEVPLVSTLGYRPGDTVANQALVPVTNGTMCLYAHRDTEVVIDINGFYRSSGGSGFTPVTPVRLYDTRQNVRLQAGEERVLTVTGVTPGAPAGAESVALNLTAIKADWFGFARVYPCGSPAGSEISSINFAPVEVRANSVVTPVAGNGTICISASVAIDVAIDLTGYFADGGLAFQPLSPVRMFDSRLPQSALNEATGGMPVPAGGMVRLQIAGRQGVPSGAKAASVNITAVDNGSPSFITAYPCGARPDSSNLNIAPHQSVTANGAMIKLSSEGELCLYSLNSVHLVVDINGVWI
jgi:hypothetical protein